MNRTATFIVLSTLLATFPLTSNLAAQSVQPYSNAVTDNLIHPETPMAVPARGVLFNDPDFGSTLVRVTDENTNFVQPGTALTTEGSGQLNMWSSDSKKFYVLGGARAFGFAFDPATMAVSPLPGATSGQGLLLPFGPGGTFSFNDPDLMYGTTNKKPLTISSYRFSTGAISDIIDTTSCGEQPALVAGPGVVSDDDVSPNLSGNRWSISEGGHAAGEHMFVVVYDKRLGCRWYNTQTGQIGGAWGKTGLATATAPYVVRHAYMSRSGKHVYISVNNFGWYVWDIATLKVTGCGIHSGMDCNGYSVVGYDSYINAAAVLDDMQIEKRSFNNIAQFSQLVFPLPKPGYWGQPIHFTWSNVDAKDSTPACGSTHAYDGDPGIDQPYANEIFCVETDGLASTVWRFAHNRATYIPPYFTTQPLGNTSRDGRFFIFSSDWDTLLGTGSDGKPRSDVFIVKLQ
jgi:hypothetical protein